MNEAQKGQVNASAAEVYEQFFVPALFEQWAPRMVELAGVGSGQRVLDVACGTGVLTRAVCDAVGPDGEVIGLDSNQGMLAAASARTPAIEWRRGYAEGLPFDSASFDRVVSQFGLMFFEDPRAASREMLRVLHPDGQLAVAVWGPLEQTPGYAAITRLLERLFGEDVADAMRAPYSMGDADALEKLFEVAGASSVEVCTLVGQAKFESLDAWIHTDVKGWTLADLLDDAQYEQLRAQARTELTEFVTDDGSVRFDTPAHIVRASR